MLFTGENVRSYPATAVVRCRECVAMVAATSRASAGGRPCCAVKYSMATWVRTSARSSSGDRVVPRVPRRGSQVSDPCGDLDPKRRHVAGVHRVRRPQPGDRPVVALGQPGTLQLFLPLLRERVVPGPEQGLHLGGA